MAKMGKRYYQVHLSLMAVFSSKLTCLILLATMGSPVPHAQHSVLIIVGGTGDLAAKYLWQSIFDIYYSSLENLQLGDSGGRLVPAVNHTFDFYAAGRSQQDIGNVVLSKILTNGIKCDIDESEMTSMSVCRQRLTEFIDKVVYITLKNEEDFKILCIQLTARFAASSSKSEKELILFMAIPPDAYETVLQRFSEQCTMLRSGDVKMKIALEKPFGFDKASAETMSMNVLSLFEEEEIYRVDHYLGKSVVKNILPFRNVNPEVENLLNKDHVDRVEIFLKETVGVEERFEVYNSLGVLRDIHQNHLTQLLTLTAMDLPSDLTNSILLNESKERLLRQVESVRRHGSLFAQYENYGGSAKAHERNKTDSTPTFAASAVKINSPRWRGVPFLLVSGKQLDRRESYIRVVFKDNRVCVSQCGDKKLGESKIAKQIIFHVGGGNIKRPSILVSKSFTKPECPGDMKESLDLNLASTSAVYGDDTKNFFVCSVQRDRPAYTSVFEDILSGKRESFVSTSQLILSWQVWDYLVHIAKKIRIYQNSDPQGYLNFMIKESQLEFVEDDDEAGKFVSSNVVIAHVDHMDKFVQVPAAFLGQKLITSDADNLAYLLAKEIDLSARNDIHSKGSFHIALSGGTSLHKVLQILAQSFANLHWHSIHVWQVDERCVPHQDERSNFQVLDRELLRFVDIPFSNIHAMPVDTAGRLCDPELGGSHAYADSLRHIVPNSQLDFIILGLGTDGHIASLFPSSPDLLVDSNTFVITTEDGPADTPNRMTLTLPLINKAKRIAIFVTGKHKQGIINDLEMDLSQSVEKYPVLGVNPVNGTVTWYIDYSAYTPE